MAKWSTDAGGYVDGGYVPCENGRGRFDRGEKSGSKTDWDDARRENHETLMWAINRTKRDPNWVRKYVRKILPMDRETSGNPCTRG